MRCWRAACTVCVFVIAAAIGCTTAMKAVAADIKTFEHSDGTRIRYVLALPTGFKPGREYPVLVALPGGPQTIATVQGGLERFWLDEALHRGFIVVSPAAPAGKPFYKGGSALLPELLNQLLKTYRVKAGKFHLAGHSNGAVSAFRAAIRYPHMFLSLTVIAGFPEDDKDFAGLDQIGNITISMFVGDSDLYWKDGMERTFQRLRNLGHDVHFEIIPRNGHFLPDLSFENSRRIFAHIKP